jgi:outer membrane protein assembly factor BamB
MTLDPPPLSSRVVARGVWRIADSIGEKSGIYWALNPNNGAVVWNTQVPDRCRRDRITTLAEPVLISSRSETTMFSAAKRSSRREKHSCLMSLLNSLFLDLSPAKFRIDG